MVWILFFQITQLPTGKKETDVKYVCNIFTPKYKTQGVRMTAGGNLVEYKVNVSTPTENVVIMKIFRNSIISDKDSDFICLDVK